MIVRYQSYSGQNPTPTITIRNEAGTVIGDMAYPTTTFNKSY